MAQKYKDNAFRRLSYDFYSRNDVVQIARDLIGKYVFSNVSGEVTCGKIVETEAYNGRMDKASHSFQKRTSRTEVMYGPAGRAYVYLCYGIHHLFNIVTNESELADAVLVRALEPQFGKEEMIKRRGKDKGYKLTSGPGTLSQAMGFTKELTGIDLITSNVVWICESSEVRNDFEIETDRRVGVDYAAEDALLPWRFFIKGNKWISKKKQKDATHRFQD